MAKKAAISRYENVDFHFLGGDEDEFLQGTVLVRDAEMVLDIRGGYEPYEVVGKLQKHWYKGTNIYPDAENEVKAKWAEVDGTYVGRWLEGTNEYLFSFELGTPRKGPKDAVKR